MKGNKRNKQEHYTGKIQKNPKNPIDKYQIVLFSYPGVTQHHGVEEAPG